MNFFKIKSEIYFITQRSQGAGGQNVNRTNSSITLKWAYQVSPVLSPEQKQTISHKLSSRINDEGEIYIRCEVHRDQLQNKKETLDRLEALLKQAFFKPKKRVATKPTRSSVKKRLDSKSKHSEKKRQRRLLD